MTNDIAAGKRRSGGCLCGQVRYTTPAEPLTTAVCHCRDCQKQAGSALSILAVFPREAVHFEGKISCFNGIGTSGRAVLRHFCGQCGSPIYSDSEAMAERGILAIKAGTLDEVADLRPSVQYWTSSRQEWLPLPEGCAIKSHK
jgi:hypothetical protein